VCDFEKRQPRSVPARFASLLELVHAWRRFPFGDPEIPDSLLPSECPDGARSNCSTSVTPRGPNRRTNCSRRRRL
jgi:DNA-binding transcriptional regulator PaaX